MPSPQFCFLSSVRSAVVDFALFPCLTAFYHRKASDLGRRKARENEKLLPKCQEFILYLPPSLLLLYLLDRCFLPARWAVSMARVSSTGRWGQMAQAKLGKQEKWIISVCACARVFCVPACSQGVLAMVSRSYFCHSTPPTPRFPNLHPFTSSQRILLYSWTP